MTFATGDAPPAPPVAVSPPAPIANPPQGDWRAQALAAIDLHGLRGFASPGSSRVVELTRDTLAKLIARIDELEIGNANYAKTMDVIAAAAATPDAAGGVEALTKPWADYHGDLPDYDHPLRCVFESGVQYAVQLLAKELKVDDWTPCDGTEEYDGDLGGTLMNIVLAAMPEDEHGDRMHPRDVRAALASTGEK